MAVKDKPIDLTTQTFHTKDNVVDHSSVDKLLSTQDKDMQFEATKAALIQNYIDGSDPVSTYPSHRDNPDLETATIQLKNTKSELDKQELVSQFEQNPDGTSGNPIEQAGIIAGLQDQVETNNTVNKQTIDSVVHHALPEEDREYLAGYLSMYESLAKTIEEKYTTSDYVLDFTANVIPFVDTLTRASLTGVVFNQKDVIQDMVIGFKSMPIEEQQLIWPVLQEEILKDLGPINGIETLAKFLDPAGEERLGDFSNWWKALDVADVAGLGKALAAKSNQIRRSFNIPKLMDRGGNKTGAAKISAQALVDDNAKEMAKMDTVTTASNAMPFDVSLQDIAYTKGLTTDIQNELKSMFNIIDSTVDDIVQGNGYLKEGILNTRERAEAEKEALNFLSMGKAEEVSIVSSAENSTIFKYKVKDEDGTLLDQQHELKLTLNDVGAWDIAELGPIEDLLGSPTAIFKGLAREDVNVAQRIDNEVAKIFKDLQGLQSEVLAPIGSLLSKRNRKRLREVDEALLKGDSWVEDTVDPVTGLAYKKRGKVFTPEELRASFDLDTAQIQTYYGMNRLFNNIWVIRNNAMRQQLEAFGYKKVGLLDQESSFGKVYKDSASASKAQGPKIAYDISNDKVVRDIDITVLDEQYALQKVLVKLDEPYMAKFTGGKYTHVLVDKDSIEDLPMVVLHRKEGYVPRINKDARWFAKEFNDQVVDEQTVQRSKTLRFFDTKVEADRWISTQRAKWIKAKVDEAIAANPEADSVRLREQFTSQAETKFKALSDRQLEIEAAATGNVGFTGSGGLYTGARSEDALLFGINGEEGRRISAFEAMTNLTANVARLVPINQWRLGLEQRWINTANKVLDRHINKFEKLDEAGQSLPHIRFLNRMYDEIRTWQGFPTADERLFNAVAQNLTEWAAKNDLKRSKEFFGYFRDKDPVGRARAIAFHSFLGWFNPVQLWVQSQGASIALSQNIGKNAFKALRREEGIRLLGGVEEDPKLIARAASRAGIPEEEMLGLVQAWKKSGLQDSVLQTADHAAALKGHGIAMDAFSRVSDQGLMFYRWGELFNRRFSFASAYEDWATKSGKTIPSDAELKGIIDRTHNLMLNMSKANRAAWQKGILSLPTQFWQVTSKSLETILGFNKNLTPVERGRLILSQLALYGTAGVPLANFANDFITQVAGLDPEEHPLVAKTINEGFWGWTALGVFGADLEIGSRGSLLGGVGQIVDDLIYSEKSVATKFLGAFGTVNHRFWNEFHNNVKPWMLGGTDTSLITGAKILFSPFLHTVSTWNNAEKAMYMHFVDTFYNSNQNPISERDFSITEELGKLIGFRIGDEIFINNVNEANETISSIERKIQDIIMEKYHSNALLDSMGMEANWEDWELMKASMIGTLPEDSQSRIIEAIKERTTNPTTKLERAVRLYQQKALWDKTTDSLINIKDTLTGNSILIPPGEDEE